MATPDVSSKTTEDVRRALGPGRPSAVRRIVTWVVLAGLVGVAVFAIRAWRIRAASKGPTYETAEVKRGDVLVTVTATGTLQAVTSVEVGAEVTGKVLTVKVEANDVVKKGQLLAEIDPEQLRASADQAMAQVSQANASIMQAKATVTEAQLALERAKSLREQGLLGQADLESATAAKQRADANLASANASATLAGAAYKSAKSRLDKTKIYSPIDGSVLSRLVEPGQTVTAGFTTPVLFKLAQDLTLMRLNVDVDEADVGRVGEGLDASFTVEAYPGRKFGSKVISLRNEPKTSQNVVTYQAVLAVDNAEKLLRPGMTCTATIVSETKKDALTVPNAALRFTPPSTQAPEKKAGVVESEKKQHVWILQGKTPVAIDVVVGASDGIVTEILGGDLKPGTQVIVDVKEAP
jgi:HlyD family secretion protein